MDQVEMCVSDHSCCVKRQGLDYDAEGDYVRVWVPELAGVRGGQVHHPWTMSGELLSRCGVEIGVDYPKVSGISIHERR